MKKILFLSFISALFLISCDYEDMPYPKKDPNIVNPASCTDFTFPPTSKYKKILIEDYTGHTCAFCPYAAVQLHEIDSMYPGQIVGLAIHIGDTFAKPDGGYGGSPDTAFLADYRTPVGDAFNDMLTVTTAGGGGLPQGLINRRDYNATTQTHLKYYNNWKAYVAGIVDDTTPEATIQIGINYDPTSRKVCCAVKDSFLTAMDDSVNLVVLLVQDSSVNWQNNVGVIEPNYIHRHILRTKLTEYAAGLPLGSGAVPAGAVHINKFAYSPVPDKYPTTGAENNKTPFYVNACHIVAFIYNRRTYEVIQVEQAKLIN